MDRFAGGTSIPLTFNRDVSPDRLQISLSNFLRAKDVTNPDSRFELVRRSSAGGPVTDFRTNLEAPEAERLLQAFGQSLPNDPSLVFERRENFGAQVAKDTQVVALTAIVASWLAIIAYLWFRFKSVTFGFAAVIALVHDVLIALGAVALSPYKIDLPMIAAFLTIIGFSVNDTIVIFDRMREKMRTSHDSLDAVVNGSINETLSRTLLTNANVLAVVLVLFFLGGTVIHDFALVMVVGGLLGTYSTVAIATPLIFERTVRARKQRPRRAEPAPA